MKKYKKPWYKEIWILTIILIIIAVSTLIVISIARPNISIEVPVAQNNNELNDSTLRSSNINRQLLKLNPYDLLTKLEQYPPLQAQESFDNYYKDRYVQWPGYVMGIEKLPSGEYSVCFYYSEDDIPFGFVGTFDNNWKERLVHLETDDRLLVQGKLIYFSSLMFILDDCILINGK